MDVKQGKLNNSYFVNSLSVLAESNNRIAKLFSKIDQDSYNFGVYEVNFAIDGEMMQIIVDDLIFTDQYFPAFASGKLWVVLLEKAWAKLHGSYFNSEHGLAHEALRDLTGAPSYEFIINKE
jgi:hypothetical protein